MALSKSATLSAVQRFSTTRAGAWAMLIFSNALFAGSYVSAKLTLREISPIMINVLRFSLASLVLLPIVIAGRKRLRFPARMLPRFAGLVLMGFVLNKLLEYAGLNLTTASDTALLISTETIFTAILSWVVLREHFSRAVALALGVGLAGVYLIIERGFIPHLEDAAGGTGARVLGDLLVIGALLFESGYTVSGKSLLSRFPPLLITAASVIGSLVFWLPLGAEEVIRTGWPELSFQGWFGVAWLAICVTVIGYFLWFQALTVVDATSAASSLFVQPLLGTLSAIIFLGEGLTWATIAGGMLILVSVYFVSRPKGAAVQTPAE
ncbi:MAG TPA: DMT family transporter [Ktedonobacterales bacterium]